MTSHDPVTESLLVHATFVQRLTHALAGADGDDLAQETWAAALQAGNGTVHSARRWLATIARNLARNLARSEGRRRRRETHAAGKWPAMPSVADIVAREEARRHVVGAVVALPEPLRSVVLLRFFEGLDSRAISRRLGTPASTVRTQLQRALAALRQRLDSEHGERRLAWSLPLLAWSPDAPGVLPLLLRTAWTLRVALGLAVFALAVWLVVPLLNPPPVAPAAPPVALAGGERRAENAQPATPTVPPHRELIATAPAAEHGPEDLWGRVVDAAKGDPVAGAEIVLEHRDADEMNGLDLAYRQRSETIGTARSGADGGFTFRVARALQHCVEVRAGGYAPLRETMCTGGSQLVLRLQRPASLDGTVRSAEAAPLGGVTVFVQVRGRYERTSVRTADDGAFHFGDLPPCTGYVYAEPTGGAGTSWQTVMFEPGQGARVEITVPAGRTVHGTVRDAATGYAIGGARVDNSWTLRGGAITAADGSYELAGLGGRETLYVRAEGYADETQRLLSQDSRPAVDFALGRGDVLTGRVVDGAGHGLGKAYVAAAVDQWRSGSNDTFWRSGLVDGDGRFRIDCLSRDQSLPRAWQLLVRAPGMGSRVLAVPFQRLAAGEVDLGDIRLATQGIVEGRVLRSDGAPVERAEITLRGTPDGFLALTPERPRGESIYHLAVRSTRTAGDGSYRIAGLAAGGYTAEAHPEGVPWHVASSLQQVADGTIVTVPDLIAEPGLTITGHVRIAGQRMLPVDANIEITADGARSGTVSAKVAADGSFRLERLDPGTYVLAALTTPSGFAMAPHVGVVAGSKDIELMLTPATTIEGIVVDADGKPVRGSSVYFFPEGVSSARNMHSDADGRFRIEIAPGVTGKLGASHPDREWCQAHQEGVSAGTTGLVLKLQK